MQRKALSPTAFQETLHQLTKPAQVRDYGPIAARFIYSLRLIAIHDRAQEDPITELSLRLGSVDVAAKAMNFAQTIKSLWPENIQLSRFCCSFLTYDENTIAKMIACAEQCDFAGFERLLEGFVRPGRIEPLWHGAQDFTFAEFSAV